MGERGTWQWRSKSWWRARTLVLIVAVAVACVALATIVYQRRDTDKDGPRTCVPGLEVHAVQGHGTTSMVSSAVYSGPDCPD